MVWFLMNELILLAGSFLYFNPLFQIQPYFTAFWFLILLQRWFRPIFEEYRALKF